MKMKIKLQMEPGFTQHAHYGFAIFHPISSPSKLVVIAPTQTKASQLVELPTLDCSALQRSA